MVRKKYVSQRSPTHYTSLIADSVVSCSTIQGDCRQLQVWTMDYKATVGRRLDDPTAAARAVARTGVNCLAGCMFHDTGGKSYVNVVRPFEDETVAFLVWLAARQRCPLRELITGS